MSEQTFHTRAPLPGRLDASSSLRPRLEAARALSYRYRWLLAGVGMLVLATIVVVNRPGIDPPRLDLGPDTRPLMSVTVPPIGIASHDLRRRLAEGRSIRYQVPRGVEAYIEANGLYRPGRT